MKKILLSIIAAFLVISTITAKTITITVANFAFTPSSVTNAVVGDTIKWLWQDGSHTTTSTSVPSGATTWDSPLSSTSTSFSYKVTVAGTYSYKCTPHAGMGMTGTIVVTSVTGLSNLTTTNTALTAYPSPFSRELTVDYGNIDISANTDLQIVDITGKVCYKSKAALLNTRTGKTIIDLEMLNSGIYFVYLTNASKHNPIKVVKYNAAN